MRSSFEKLYVVNILSGYSFQSLFKVSQDFYENGRIVLIKTSIFSFFAWFRKGGTPKFFYVNFILFIWASIFYSHAVGMAVARPYGFEIDFLSNPISRSALLFFAFILKFIFRPILVIKRQEKNHWHKNISFSKADFHQLRFI